MEDAHSLPLRTKARFADPERGSGELGAAYNGPDVGYLEPSYDGVSVAAASAWDYSPEGAKKAGDNWDADLPAYFRETMEDLYQRQNGVGRAVLTGIAEVLDLPPQTFSDSFDRGDLGTIRLISYPGFEVPVHTFSAANANSGDHAWTYSDDEEDDDDVCRADVGIAPHTDFEAFTLMHQDAPGLQLLSRTELGKARTGVDRRAGRGAFIVIVGDILEGANGVFRATPHRVVRQSSSRRSIIRFNAVAPDAVVAPLPKFGSRNARHHGRHGDDVKGRRGVVGRGDEHEPVNDVRPRVARKGVYAGVGMGVQRRALRTNTSRLSSNKPIARS